MKKLVASLLCVMLMLNLVACGDKKETKPEENKTPATQTQGNKEDSKTETEGKNEETKTEADETATEENKTEAPNEEDTDNLDAATLSGKLALEFKKLIADSSDLNAIAEKLSAEDFCGYTCGSMEVEPGFLNGFSEEIKGFKKGVTFMPMIGSIPFVSYIFEVEDAAAFKATLLSKADPRWNICTEAKETVCVTSGNYVFFTMCPGEE